MNGAHQWHVRDVIGEILDKWVKLRGLRRGRSGGVVRSKRNAMPRCSLGALSMDYVNAEAQQVRVPSVQMSRCESRCPCEPQDLRGV